MNLILVEDKDFIEENLVKLKDRRHKHIKEVHRAEQGDILRVGKINGLMGDGEVISLNDEEVVLKLNLYKEPPKKLNIKLVLAMPRPKALKRIIQHATAMGIKEIYIIKTWRVEKSFWSSPVLSEESLKEQMILGLEQCKDTVMPTIKIEKLFKPFVEDKLPDIIKGTKAIVAHPISDKKCPRNVEEAITLAIGTDGGFIEYEIEKLKEIGFEVVNLGERILRVETAVPVLLSRLS